MGKQPKHTPGPWKTNGVVISARVDFSQRDLCEMRASATTRGHHPSDKSRAEMVANARLIAAAPDMLTVLLSIMPPDALIGESYDPPVPADEILREFFFTWGKLRAARAAIAKALGQDRESA